MASLLKNTKILIVAQNASTRFGGEAIIPVHYFRILLGRGYRVSLIAHARNRKDLEDIFGSDCNQIHYVEDTIWHRLIWKASRAFPKRLSDEIFGTVLNFVNELYQKRLIRGILNPGEAAVIHQPIPVSPNAPSSIHGLDAPVIIGPMNGGMIYPPGWEDLESPIERFVNRLTRWVAPVLNKIMPGKRQAQYLLVANERTRSALPVKSPRVQVLVENGVDLSLFRPTTKVEHAGDGAIALVFMGRLVAWKALDFTLAAIAETRARGLDVTLKVLGDGPERASLEKRASDLGLKEAVQFFGFRPQPECIQILSSSDALILNSVYECGGAVVLEAMSVGKPVIASDWGGPADYLDESTGILVSPVPRETFATRLAVAIEYLALHPKIRTQLGKNGISRVRDNFDWERKVDTMMNIYADSLSPERAR